LEQTLVGKHIGEDALELYAMGRLTDPEAAELEEHLLLCTQCQEELERIDDFVLAFRVAAKQARTERQPEGGVLSRVRAWFRKDGGFFRPVTLAPAAAAFALVLTVIVAPIPIHEPQLETVQLESARGEAGIASVAAGNRLHLVLDTRGLPDLPVYKIELADSRGRAVWSASAKPAATGLSVTTDQAVTAGRHWLRIYSGSNDLLREFGVMAVAGK
jgi:hypothetical protein